MQDCHSLISEVEYQGQTNYTRILAYKAFINTYYCIGHRLELKYYVFAQVLLLNNHQAAHQTQKNENWKLFGRSLRSSYGLLDQGCCLGPQKMITFSSRLFKKSWHENRSSSRHGFQTLHFIHDQFGCKLWLKSTQNHAIDLFQAFTRRHLKLQCCLIETCADALFSDRLSI